MSTTLEPRRSVKLNPDTEQLLAQLMDALDKQHPDLAPMKPGETIRYALRRALHLIGRGEIDRASGN